MTNEEFIKLYWRQYLSLEKDMIDTDDYVTIDSKNYGTFSNEYAKLFVMACTEIDSLSVEFSKMVKEEYHEESAIKANNILKRIDTIKTAYDKLGNYHVKTKFPYNELHYVPYRNFSDKCAEDWWQDYNEVKHNRTELSSGGKYNYEKANLKNTMNALSALFLMCFLIGCYLNDGKFELVSEAKLFEFAG